MLTTSTLFGGLGAAGALVVACACEWIGVRATAPTSSAKEAI